jgi:amino acid transporter
MPLGIAGIAYILPISTAIIVLLIIVYFSYRQTIAAYPAGGGSYTVARENLGARMGPQLFLLEYGQDLLVQAPSKVEHVRRPAIKLALEPFLGDIAERWHFRWLNVIGARSLCRVSVWNCSTCLRVLKRTRRRASNRPSGR